MVDDDARALLTATAEACLSEPFDLLEPARLGWVGLLTAPEKGGEGWLPGEASLLSLETGRQNAASTWTLAAAAAAITSRSGAEEDVTMALLSGELLGTISVVPDRQWDGDRLEPGGQLQVLCERAPDFVVAIDQDAERVRLLRISSDQCSPLGDPDVLETTRGSFAVRVGTGPGLGIAPTEVRPILDAARVLLDADTIGTVGAALSLVIGHLVEREAFGVPLASFQSLQHRLVDWVVFERSADALVTQASESLAQRSDDAERLVTALHSFVEERSVTAIDDLIQLAGAIGFTWEYPLHHLLRRVATNASLLGTGRASRARLLSAVTRESS
jgi:alkylation response protein AidB-like acyl-CoA dehydrogenase